jgi:hypothetical protein
VSCFSFRFIHIFKSGCIKTVLTSSIKHNKIKDFNVNSYYGVACLGMEGATSHHLWNRWLNMIGRCYNPKHSQYKSYENKGIYVEEYLRNFKNYISCVESLPNNDKLLNDSDNWQIDKDLKSGYYYSRDSLTIMKSKENLELENAGKRIRVDMYSINDKFLKSFESISEAEINTGIYRGNIARVIRGEANTAGGFKWKNKEVEYDK